MNKKLYLMATVAIFAACSSNDVKNDIQESNNEIGFEAVTYKATKAEITDNATLATAGGFVVWGYKAKNQATMNWATDYYEVFNAVNVTAKANTTGTYISGDNTNWTYTTKKYWDNNAKYCFYAVAPAGGSYSIAGNTDAKKITITGAQSALAADSKDYLISRSGVIGRAGTDHSNVDFTFNHTMAKVDFKLKKADNVDGAVKVQKITMTGWDGGAGTFVQTLTATPTNNELSHTEWTIPTPNTSASFEILSNESAELTTTAATTTTKTYIMVPQTIDANKLTFTIDYTIGSEPFKAQVGKVTTQQIWGTDSHITYTLTIDPKAIEFDVASIVGFTNTGTGAATIPVE